MVAANLYSPMADSCHLFRFGPKRELPHSRTVLHGRHPPQAKDPP